jgi:hypothetical protein
MAGFKKRPPFIILLKNFCIIYLTMVKPNPYVYSSKDFDNLFDKEIKWQIIGKEIITKDKVAEILKNLKQPNVKILGKSIEEKILSIFLDENIRFGDKNLILDKKDYWIDKITYFTTKKLPVRLAILGFPFKMPVKLKTVRTLPDMGELLSLARLLFIANLIKKIYKPGAEVIIFTEEGFYKFIGVDKKNASAYIYELKKWLKFLRWNSIIKLKSLSLMEKLPDFEKIFNKKLRENKKLLKENDPEFLRKFNEAFIPIFRIVNSLSFDEKILMDVYNDQIKDEDLPKKALKIRNLLKRKATLALLNYFAYLQTRDELNFIEKTAPHALLLTVSPKYYRLPIYPVSKEIEVLPYHGVPIYFQKNNKWQIDYLINLKRKNWKLVEVYLYKDKDKTPFFYKVVG